ncbi:MAG: serine/threonine protein kinase [Myxococcota bacterium]
MSLESGSRVGRYTISRLIAQGGMAEVYRAEQDLAGGITRPVAVKVIRPEYSESEDFRAMFLDEARTACTLSHPNIVHIYEVGETDDGQLYMAMELVSGETLATVNRTLREHDERFSDEALFAIGILCCSALEAVHALKVEGGVANLVHRDVSPHNLLLSTTGSLKLIDFGIAKAATNRNLTMPGVTKGKAGYFSPEQAMGKKLDGRSDLFSLGVTLYKLASGGTPFDDYKNHAERHAALVRGQWKDLDEVYPGLPDGLYDVVRRALAVKPDERFQSAREMREALERAAFDAGIRVGQSSLLGYLDDEGEVTASGGSRMSAFPAITAPPSATLKPVLSAPVPPPRPASVRQLAPVPAPTTKQMPAAQPRRFQTDRLDPVAPRAASPLPRRLALAAAFLLAVVLGVGGAAVLLGGGTPAPEPGHPVVVERAKPTPREPLVEVPVAEPRRELEPTPDAAAVEVEVEVEPVAPKTPVKAPPKKPTSVAKPVEKPSPPKVAEVAPPPPVKESIPEGEGKLSINVAGSGRHVVLVQGEDWGAPPIVRKLSSGAYTVQVKLEDGTASSFKASVWPDKTTVLELDPSSLKWSTRSK